MTLPDTDDLDTLGGVKTNAHPVEDPTTDLDADQDNIQRCDVAMMTHTAIRAWARFTSAATTGAMILVAHDAQWGNAALVAPALARTSDGLFTLTYPASVDDELAEAHTTNFRGAWGVSRGGATLYFIHVHPTSANVLTVRIFNAAGALNNAVGVDFDVYAI